MANDSHSAERWEIWLINLVNYIISNWILVFSNSLPFPLSLYSFKLFTYLLFVLLGPSLSLSLSQSLNSISLSKWRWSVPILWFLPNQLNCTTRLNCAQTNSKWPANCNWNWNWNWECHKPRNLTPRSSITQSFPLGCHLMLFWAQNTHAFSLIMNFAPTSRLGTSIASSSSSSSSNLYIWTED